jgi:hypothetical protein
MHTFLVGGRASVSPLIQLCTIMYFSDTETNWPNFSLSSTITEHLVAVPSCWFSDSKHGGSANKRDPPFLLKAHTFSLYAEKSQEFIKYLKPIIYPN